MTWIFLTAVFTVLMLVGVIVGPKLTDDDGKALGSAVALVVLGIYAIGFVGALALFSVHRVENGHVALIKSFGAITGQSGDGHGGLVLTAPWQSIQQANVQIQSMCPNGKNPDGQGNCSDNYGAVSSETVDVYINAKLNFHVNPDQIQTLFRTVGPDYVNKIVEPRVSQILKEETVKYKAVDVAPERETIRQAVTKRLVEELGSRSIVADDFLLTNISFNSDVQKAIDQKVIQAQAAAASQAQVQVKKAEADQATAVAQGQADAKRIAAKGDAEANDIVNASLTGPILQLRLAQTLGDRVQFLPSGQGVIIDPATLLAPKK